MFSDDITRSELLFQIKLLKDKVAAFKSGEKYIRTKEECGKIHLADLRTIKRLEKEKAGGQPGHIHNGRKRITPTKIAELPTPEKYKNTIKYKPTGRKIRKQLIKLHVITEVIEYVADEYRNKETGQRVHTDFPTGIVDEVTYDGTVKAMAYLINNELYTSIDKTRKFLNEISHGEIALSTGFICKLTKEFSEKTQEERNEIFLKLLSSPVLHADFTFGRAGDKQTSMIITAAGDTVMYQRRKKKGDEGIKGSPLELYEGTLVSDHEASKIRRLCIIFTGYQCAANK